MKLSPKYRDFLRYNAPVEFLEGTTYAGKTTVGVVKFMLKVAQSDKKQHIISGLDLGTIEKNIITKDLGILDVFGDLVQYNASGKGENRLPHVMYQTPKGDKVIYILGYNDRARWKKALGSQSGCILIDEINVADMDYVREASIRCDYLMATLNPDDPNLPIYTEYINHSRPVKKWADDTPSPIIAELQKQEPKPGWVHWFFSFKDNAGATEEKIEQIMSMSPVGTKLYKNKILGLRGRHTGLVFNLDEKKSVISERWLLDRVNPDYKGDDKMKFILFTAGVDTSYSRKSDDRIVFNFGGITTKGIFVTLAIEQYNNTTIVQAHQNALAPSDIPPLLDAFLRRNVSKWGMIDCCYIDEADQATITEVEKYKREKGSIFTFAPSWKKLKIIDRIMLQQGWMANGHYLIVRDHCQPLIDEMNVYSWLENKQEPEDANDHSINANQYSWMPYRHRIGTERN